MTFNFASFIGGAADQMEANRQQQMNQQRIGLERQRTEDSSKAVADQLETSRMNKEAMQRKLDAEKAAQEADSQFGKLMTQVGKPVESAPVQSSIPTDVSGMDKAPSQAELERASSPQIKVGGVSLMQPSDALRKQAEWAAGHDNPLIQAQAARYAAQAEGVRGAEAFKIGAQTGDIAAAERHLSGKQNVAAVELPGGGIQLDYGDGKKSRVYSDQMDYLNDLQARMSPEGTASYAKIMNARQIAQEKARIDEQRERDASQDRKAGLAIQMAKLGQGRGSSSGSGDGSGSGSSKEVESYLGKQSAENQYDPVKAGFLIRQVNSMNQGIPKERAAMAVSQAIRNPSSISVGADPATGELFGYVDSGAFGGKVKVAGYDQLASGGLLSSPDPKTGTLAGDDLKTMLEKQAAVARAGWAASPQGQRAILQVRGSQEDGIEGLTLQERAAVAAGRGPVQMKDQNGKVVTVDASQVSPALRNAVMITDEQDRQTRAAAEKKQRSEQKWSSWRTPSETPAFNDLQPLL